MAFTETLISVIIGLSVSILFMKGRLSIILTYGAISAIAVVVFSLYAAPDVALAEASIGMVFTIFLYMVVLQHKGKLWVTMVKIDRSIDELELEFLSSYCKAHDLELRVVESTPNEALEMLKEGKTEIVAAALVSAHENDHVKMTNGFLETKMLYFENDDEKSSFLGGFNTFLDALKAFEIGKIKNFNVDLIRYLHSSLEGHNVPSPKHEENGFFYSFAVINDEPELLDSLNEYLKNIKENGKLREMVERHIR